MMLNLWNKLQLKSRNPEVRQRAVAKLAAAGALPTLDLLFPCLADEDGQVRRAAAKALGSGRNDRARR